MEKLIPKPGDTVKVFYCSSDSGSCFEKVTKEADKDSCARRHIHEGICISCNEITFKIEEDDRNYKVSRIVKIIPKITPDQKEIYPDEIIKLDF